MKRILTLASMLAMTLVLASCTVTFLPDAELEPSPVQTSPSPTPAPTPSPRPPVSIVPNFPIGEVLQYQCTDARLLVEYTSNDSVRVNFNGWNNLTRSVIRDGWFTYTNADYTWFANGKDGYLMRGNDVMRSNCKLP